MFVLITTAMINPYIPSTPAMTTGTMDFITNSGRITPMDAMPTPDFAVPYAAPMQLNTSALVAPMKPKNGATSSLDDIAARRVSAESAKESRSRMRARSSASDRARVAV